MGGPSSHSPPAPISRFRLSRMWLDLGWTGGCTQQARAARFRLPDPKTRSSQMNAAVADAGRMRGFALPRWHSCSGGFAIFAWARYTSLVLHEAAHASLPGHSGSVHLSLVASLCGSESSFTDVPGIAGTTSSHVVRHAGWIFSFVIALAVSYLYCTLTWCQDSHWYLLASRC